MHAGCRPRTFRSFGFVGVMSSDPVADELEREESMREADGYVVPAQQSMESIIQAGEGEDEAMRRYRASLLGAAASSGSGMVAGDPRRVVITEMAILVNGRDDPIIFDLTDEAVLADLHVGLKEGCEYRTQLSFRVQNEIVSGLKYKSAVKRMGRAILKVDEMLGSYAPDPTKVNTVVFPRREWEQAPSGLVARATYAASSAFVDDDGTEHLTFDWKLTIKKDWD